jgi:hypothetical protein
VLQPGRVEYCVAVEAGGTTLTFPPGMEITPGKWDFSAGSLWTMNVLMPGEPVVVLDVLRDRKDFVFPHFSPSLRYALDYGNGPTSEEASVSLRVKFSGASRIPFGFQTSVAEFLKPLAAILDRYHQVAVNARSLEDTAGTIGINLVMSDGKSFAARVVVFKDWHESRIPISAFRSSAALVLPDCYPRFLPKVSRASKAGAADIRLLDRIQILVDPPDAKQHGDTREMSFEVSSIRLIP